MFRCSGSRHKFSWLFYFGSLINAYAGVTCILTIFTGTAGTSLCPLGLDRNIVPEHTGTAGTF